MDAQAGWHSDQPRYPLLRPDDHFRPVSEFMTYGNLVTAPTHTSLDEAKAILQQHRIEKLLLVDEEGHLTGLITVKDIQKKIEYPNAAVDLRRLLVGRSGGGDGSGRAGIDGCLGVDIVAVDTAHGYSAGVIRAIQRIKHHCMIYR